jgi:subtilisin family serine protease
MRLLPTLIKSLLCLALAAASISDTLAQGTYHILLRDKNHNDYSLDKPEQFLTARSIERRRLQGIALTTDDLPMSTAYLRSIQATGAELIYTLKWENALLVKVKDATTLRAIQQLPYVVAVSEIKAGNKTRQKTLNPAHTKECACVLLDTAYYGKASNQTKMIHIDTLHQLGYRGDGVLIAIMDAGFNKANINTYLKPIYDEGRMLYTYDFVMDREEVYSSSEHGAQTFSCIGANTPYFMVGTAPNASFMLFTTEDNRSETIREEYNWARAAEVGDSLGADVFSTSLGYTTFDKSDSMDNHTYAQMDGRTTPIAKAVNRAAAKGILVVSSAGNEGDDAWHYISTPGDADSGVCVGAVQPNSMIAAFSSRGPGSSGLVKPDICTQGGPAAVVNSSSVVATNYGTSFSCPIAAGAFACLRQAFPYIPNMQIIAAVQQSASYYSAPNADYGYGIPDFGRAYNILASSPAFYEHARRSPVNVFPTPFCNTFKVVLGDTASRSIELELFDMTGQKVYGEQFAANAIETPSLAWLSAGVYILRVNKTYLKRISKE